MLTWEEEVKPISPASTSGSLTGRVAPSPLRQLAPAFSFAPAATDIVMRVPAGTHATTRRIRAGDTRIINGKTDVNQLVPFNFAMDLIRHAEDTMPRGVVGLNASMFKGCLRDLANRRGTQIGLDALFPNGDNPFAWMSEMIDLKKERNFFETRVIEYQTGGALSWD